MNSTQFFVPGIPKPQGSKRGYVTKTGKVNMVEMAGQPLADWRGDVKHEAMAAQGTASVLEGPVGVALHFWMPRPKKPKHPEPTTRPDIDKLARACLDAMTSVMFRDDSQITYLMLTKDYVNQWRPLLDRIDTPGVQVTVWDRS